jgi:heterotetrameric sarcosine oxidase delta subunit
MAFLINCPNCGRRNPYEFTFGGECKQAPGQDADMKAWCEYLFFYENMPVFQDEWWYHAMGCGEWLKIRRNIATHEIVEV